MCLDWNASANGPAVRTQPRRVAGLQNLQIDSTSAPGVTLQHLREDWPTCAGTDHLRLTYMTDIQTLTYPHLRLGQNHICVDNRPHLCRGPARICAGAGSHVRRDSPASAPDMTTNLRRTRLRLANPYVTTSLPTCSRTDLSAGDLTTSCTRADPSKPWAATSAPRLAQIPALVVCSDSRHFIKSGTAIRACCACDRHRFATDARTRLQGRESRMPQYAALMTCRRDHV
jgi:hypothetical protein